MDFLKMIWTKYINPSIGVIWHVVGGAITGAVLPTLAQSAMAGQLTVASGVSTVVSGLTLALIGWAQHSNNKVIAQAANSIPPDQVAAIDAKISSAITAKIVPTALRVLLLSLVMASCAFAQTTEKTGWGINPEFSAPYMFGQDASGTFISVPSFGLGADIGWKDIVTTNGQGAVKYSGGLVLSGNLSQTQPNGPKSILNGLLGVEAGYKGINLVVGNQLLGDTLTGPGGSRWLIYIGYDVSSLLGTWATF